MTREKQLKLQREIIERNLPVPKELKDWIGDFYCGSSYNQPLPEKFSCEYFYCGELYNLPLPKGFRCKYFYCDGRYNLPLPAGFDCGSFYCWDIYSEPAGKFYKLWENYNSPITNEEYKK